MRLKRWAEVGVGASEVYVGVVLWSPLSFLFVFLVCFFSCHMLCAVTFRCFLFSFHFSRPRFFSRLCRIPSRISIHSYQCLVVSNPCITSMHTFLFYLSHFSSFLFFSFLSLSFFSRYLCGFSLFLVSSRIYLLQPLRYIVSIPCNPRRPFYYSSPKGRTSHPYFPIVVPCCCAMHLLFFFTRRHC